MAYDKARVREIIERSLRVAEIDPQVASDIAFHVLDWRQDMERLRAFFESPGGISDDQVVDLLVDFLTHAPSHIAAAAKLLLGRPVTDVFGVGAVSDSDSD